MFVRWIGTASLALAAVIGHAQLRILEYNVTNYSSGRIAEFQTIFFAEYQGRFARPDIIVGQEFLSQAGVNNFLNILNSAPNSPGDYAAASFIDGPDTDNAFFYRTSKVELLGVAVVAVGGNSPNHPRNINRYDIRLDGYTGNGAKAAIYSSHMKSGTTQDDLNRRLLEAQRIRTDAEILNVPFVLCGDTNIQSNSQAAWQELVGSKANNNGRFFDPIKTEGNWNNNSAFRFVHTQEPSTQMDDRFDVILLSSALRDGSGFDYKGSLTVPYSTTTWNDANHSYRCWGNDGSTFDSPLAISTNQMVGPVIAQALVDSVVGNGHLPVFLDLLVPPKATHTGSINLGRLYLGQPAAVPFFVGNNANSNLWGVNGVSPLHYTMSVTNGFGVPGGNFSANVGINNQHTLTVDTSVPGPKVGTITVTTDDPDNPVRTIPVTATVLPFRPRQGQDRGIG